MSRTSENPKTRLMLVDHETNILGALQRVFARESYEIETFTDATTALMRARQADLDLALSDYRMPEVDGVAF